MFDFLVIKSPAIVSGVKVYATKTSGFAFVYRDQKTIGGMVGYKTLEEAIAAGNKFAETKTPVAPKGWESVET
jgi:hypothetical protein